MARKTGMMGTAYVTETRPKKTRQGRGKHSKYAPTSRNSVSYTHLTLPTTPYV